MKKSMFLLTLMVAIFILPVVGFEGICLAKGPTNITVSITADRAVIGVGESVTLSWTTKNAAQASIDNGIGSVSLTGTKLVKPSATTTYTITASNSTQTATAKVTITVSTTPLPPTINISTTPSSIYQGESSVIAWSTSNADTASIDNGIGPVQLVGNITVQPMATTVYTITATGKGGATSKSVTVVVNTATGQILTVSLSANPTAILKGGSTILSWSSTKAISASIDNGIGSVALNGSLSVSPVTTTKYTITARDRKGTTVTKSVTVTVNMISLTILNPANNEITAKQNIFVRGVSSNILNNETGITVNGINALVYGNEFAANHIYLTQGQNVITANAFDSDNNTVTTSVNVSCNANSQYVTLTSDKDSGLSPFEPVLRIDSNFPYSGKPVVSHSGPGPMEVLPDSDTTTFHIRLTTPGLHTLTVEARDASSNVFTDTIAVVVQDAASLDALLRIKWQGVKTAWAEKNIEGGLSYFLDSAQPHYRKSLNSIAEDLPQLVADMQDIEMVYAKNNRVKYRINRLHDIDGTPVTLTYYLYFVKDKNGLWKIEQF